MCIDHTAACRKEMVTVEQLHERIVVLDFGGQYNQLIARRIRDLGVYSELLSYKTTAAELKKNLPRGIVFSGGPTSVFAKDSRKCDPAIFELGVPILGICYGMHLIATHFEATVERGAVSANGKVEVENVGDSVLLKGVADTHDVWMNCRDVVTKVPQGFSVDARTADVPVAAMSDARSGVYAVQFHPEVRHTVYGDKILKNFMYEICQCTGDWRTESFVDDTVAKLKARIGERKVLCALSGGVDSSVAAALVHKAIGDQLTCMFVDHGLLRKGEADSVMETFAGKFDMHVVKVDASARFLDKLRGVTDPEQKRKIIGNEFIRVFEEEVKKFGDHEFLAQGTVYSDVIESGTDTSATIKSHHNVGGLPEDMSFQLVEPLRKLFKDEVRQVGEALGLPQEIVWRQPFPGPGLGIRVIGEVTEERLHIVREADAILRAEISDAGLDRDIWQYFAVLTDLRSVGVTDDSRTYDYTIGIRAVHSVEGMTADWARIPYDVLQRVSSRMTKEVPGVNRVVYDITSKPPATIEWE